MRHSIPFFAIFIALIVSTTLILGIFFYEIFLVKENQIVKAYSEVKRILALKTDIDLIVSEIDAIPQLKHFTGLALLELAANDDKYISYFESRYPRYKAYNSMRKELSLDEFSPWIASVILGDTETEFDADVFAFIAVCKNDWYLNQVISRFNDILKKTDHGGFAVRATKDAYIIGALALYILRFPDAKTAGIKKELGKHIENFIEETDTIKGIPLNQLYIVLCFPRHEIEAIVRKIIKKKNQARAFELLDKYNNPDLLNHIVNKYRSSFSFIDPLDMKNIMKDRLDITISIVKIFKHPGRNTGR